MTLNKKQVKGILNILKEKNNAHRTALSQINIEGKYAYVTNGFSLIRIDLEQEQVNACITLDAIERWYKLANAKDSLTELDLIRMATVPEQKGMVNLERLFNDLPERTEIDSISFNFKYLQDIVQVLGNKEITTLDLRQGYKPVSVAGDTKTSGITAILMPMKRRDI